MTTQQERRVTLATGGVRFDEQGLVPAIVQDAATGSVLMLGWMDWDALAATERTREVHFHSRSRRRLWRKGETSGSTLHVVDLRADCDGDALLVRAHSKGPVCHTGAATCWGEYDAPPLSRTLSDLAALLRERRERLPPASYSAALFRAGREAMARKLEEEALELARAAVGETRERAISELTDLLYVMLVLATDLELTPEEVQRSLAEKKQAAARRTKAAREQVT